MNEETTAVKQEEKEPCTHKGKWAFGGNAALQSVGAMGNVKGVIVCTALFCTDCGFLENITSVIKEPATGQQIAK